MDLQRTNEITDRITAALRHTADIRILVNDARATDNASVLHRVPVRMDATRHALHEAIDLLTADAPDPDNELVLLRRLCAALIETVTDQIIDYENTDISDADSDALARRMLHRAYSACSTIAVFELQIDEARALSRAPALDRAKQAADAKRAHAEEAINDLYPPRRTA